MPLPPFSPQDKIVILTGAGISKESGLDVFRNEEGLWAEHRIEDVATPEAFSRNPELVYAFYNKRRTELFQPHIVPNPAHIALAHLQKNWPGIVTIITQNIDDLHERGGNDSIIHMHGQIKSALCAFCNFRFDIDTDFGLNIACPSCKRKSAIRPDIVWFGEMPYHMDDCEKALEEARIFIAIGTSALVYPAAGFVTQAIRALKIEVNIEETPASTLFDCHYTGLASQQVPLLVEQLLASQKENKANGH